MAEMTPGTKRTCVDNPDASINAGRTELYLARTQPRIRLTTWYDFWTWLLRVPLRATHNVPPMSENTSGGEKFSPDGVSLDGRCDGCFDVQTKQNPVTVI
jgi:hypothetical protein